ncbi:MAG: hypothetical protein IPN19_10440 [Elusimicrobia bacterium]|nr:hypothetical protein [Elusimicrobiota bacterium]
MKWAVQWGAGFKNEKYIRYVAWWLETPVLLVFLLNFQEPLISFFWGMPVLAGLLYPVLFLGGHVFNPSAIKGKTVRELAGWKMILGPLAFMDPSGVAMFVLSLAVAIVSVRHKMLNMNRHDKGLAKYIISGMKKLGGLLTVRSILGGLLLLMWSGTALAAGTGVAVGVPVLSLLVGLALFVYTTWRLFQIYGGNWLGSKEITYSGVGSGLDGAVSGRVLPVESEPFSGVIYPIYKIARKEDLEDKKRPAITAHQNLVKEAMETISNEEELEGEIPEKFHLGALFVLISNKIESKLFNAQAMVAEELDLAIVAVNDELEKQKLRRLKKEIIGYLAANHSLEHTHDKQAVIQDELRKMRDVALPLWKLRMQDESLTEFPEKFTSNGTPNGDRLEAAHNTIKDCLFSEQGQVIPDVKNGNAAVAVLGKIRKIYLDQIIPGLKKQVDDAANDEARLISEKFLTTQEDAAALIFQMICLLNAHIVASGPTVEIVRFNAATKAVKGISRVDNVRKFVEVLMDQVPEMIEGGRTAPSAIELLSEKFIESHPDDVENIEIAAKAIVDALSDPELRLYPDLKDHPVVIVSEGPLTPYQIAEIRGWGLNVQGYAMFSGTQAMHGPISIKAAGILCVALNRPREWAEFRRKVGRGEKVSVFSREGRVVFFPSKKTRKEVERVNKRADRLKMIYARHRLKPNGFVTLRGSPDSVEGIVKSVELGAEGVGLYRTEIAFYSMEGERDVPSLMDKGKTNQAFEEYMVTKLVERGKLVRENPFTIRMFDKDPNSKDKPSQLPDSALRGAQYILSDVGTPFAEQEIHAVMRAYLQSPNIRLKFPMVSNLGEARGIKAMIRKVMLTFEEGQQKILENMKIGIMAETAEAVQNISELVELFDFISIGTKDLTLSVHGINSENPQADVLLKQLDRKVINSILTIVKAAKNRKAGKIPVSACGVLAGNEIFIPVAVLLKKDLELSLPPTEVDKWNTLIPVIAEMKPELDELRKLVEKTGEDNSAAMNQKAQEIVDKALDQIDSRGKWHQIKWLRTLLDNPVTLLVMGVAGIILVLFSIYALADVQTALGGVTTFFTNVSGFKNGLEMGLVLGAFKIPENLTVNNFFREFNNGFSVKSLNGWANELVGNRDVEWNEKLLNQFIAELNRRLNHNGEFRVIKSNKLGLPRVNVGLNTPEKQKIAKQLKVWAEGMKELIRLLSANASDNNKLESRDDALESAGLSPLGVKTLADKGVSSKEIARILQRRLDTLRAVPLAVSVGDNAYADFLPIGRVSFSLGDFTVDSSNDQSVGEIAGHMTVLESEIGEGTNNLEPPIDGLTVGEAIANVLGTKPTNVEDYSPNSLAIALNEVLVKYNADPDNAKRAVAHHFAGLFTNVSKITTLTKPLVVKSWELLALLFKMSGSVSEGMRDGTTKIPGNEAYWARPAYQAMDIAQLVNITLLKNEELQQRNSLGGGTDAFNQVSAQAAPLRNPIEAVDNDLREMQSIAFFITPELATGNSDELKPSDRAVLEAIVELDRRLQDRADVVAQKWLRRENANKSKRGAIAVLYNNGKNNYKLDIVLNNLEKIYGQKLPGVRKGLTNFAAFQAESVKGENLPVVDAKQLLTNLSIRADYKVSIVAGHFANLKVDYSNVREGIIVSLILAMSSGLMCEVGLVESVKKVRQVLKQA